MPDMSDLPTYFHELRNLAGSAAAFPWKSGAESERAELAEELRRIIELSEKGGQKEVAFEYFLREMLAEFSPDNAAYHISPVCSQDSSIRKLAWTLYSTLCAAERERRPLGVAQAALTVCASAGVACKKTLAMLHAGSANKLLPPPPSIVQPTSGTANKKTKVQNAGIRLIAGTDCRT